MNILGYLTLVCLTSAVLCSGEHNKFCRDLTDYGKLYYTKTNVTVCNTSREKKCEKKPVSLCMEVPEIDCKVELFPKCESKTTNHSGTVSRPVMEMKTLPWCNQIEVLESHNKTKYECKNVTKQHCTSLWKVVNGEKVWAGNDDCRNVTWEECKPTIHTVRWMVPKMNCSPEVFTYLTFENQTTTVKMDEETCTLEKRAVCERVQRSACGITDVRNCSEILVTKCSEVEVPVPTKDKIHKQWCLFNQGNQGSPQSAGSADNKGSGVADGISRNSRSLTLEDDDEKISSLSFDDDDKKVLSNVFSRRSRRKNKSKSNIDGNSRSD